MELDPSLKGWTPSHSGHGFSHPTQALMASTSTSQDDTTETLTQTGRQEDQIVYLRFVKLTRIHVLVVPTVV